jgi:hypothetical protein
MDEREFDELFPSRPIGTKDATRMDARLRRSATLAVALWGKTIGDLQRQLRTVAWRPFYPLIPKFPPGLIWSIPGSGHESPDKLPRSICAIRGLLAATFGPCPRVHSDFRRHATLHTMGIPLRICSDG